MLALNLSIVVAVKAVAIHLHRLILATQIVTTLASLRPLNRILQDPRNAAADAPHPLNQDRARVPRRVGLTDAVLRWI